MEALGFIVLVGLAIASAAFDLWVRWTIARSLKRIADRWA